MDSYNLWIVIVLLYLLSLEKGFVSGDDTHCARLQCDPKTLLCPYRSFYADISTRTVCKGCNVCIKKGLPVDAEGCPLLPCPKSLPKGACFRPWFYNSWIVYHGKRCRTCEFRLCNL